MSIGTSNAADTGESPPAFAFPIMFEVRGKRCFVAAGGHEGAIKAGRLADLGANVVVWAADEKSLRPLAERDVLGGRRPVEPFVGPFDRALLDGSCLAVVDTGDHGLDAEIAGVARERGIPVNSVDDIPNSDWSAPAILRRGHLTIAVSTGGEAPALAVKLRDRIGEAIGPQYGELLELLAEIRPAITGSGRPFGERRRFWYELVDGPAHQAILNGNPTAAREILASRLTAWLSGDPELPADAKAAVGANAARSTPGPTPGETGLVSLVGAGPGDPELLTLKAARRLAEADAVVYDRLIDRRVLELARPDAALHDAGKHGFGEAVDQADTTDLLVRLGRSGLRVVRLKGGDPFVFGRGGEEAGALAEAGVPFEVVPGVTSGIAGPAYAGIPVTDRRFSQSVAFVTGHDSAPGGPGPDWTALAAIDTLVVFMAGRSADGIALRLLEAGKPAATPVAVIRGATTDRQQTTLLDLAGLARQGAGTPDDRPTLLVIGGVVGLAPSLAWFEPRLTAVPAPDLDSGPQPLPIPIAPAARRAYSLKTTALESRS
jgi:uroporphyrin-III C-methyltransferase/precorrin-2 dehydrogenase/sirohydrochlorin ferrochelatase